LICIFEIVVLANQVVTSLWLKHAYAVHHLQPRTSSLLLTAIKWLSYALAPAAAVTLWRMKHSAFFLLATRFALGVIWFIASRIYSAPPRHVGTVWVIYCLSIASLSLSAAIVWYVQDITAPKTIRPQTLQLA
jgi:hypothetical protein